MPLIPRRITRTSRPPIGTPIDWSNPLAQGLVGAWAFNECGGSSIFNGVDSKQKIFTATDVTLSATGLTFSDTAANATVPIADAGIVDFTKPFTTVMTCNKLGVGSSAAYGVFSKYVNSGTGVTLGLNNSSGTVRAMYKVGSGSVVLFGGNIGTTYPLRSLAFVYNGSDLSVYYNGVFEASTPVALTNPTALYKLGPTFTGAVNLANTIFAAGLYQRELSPAEIAALSANPWQIYEPELIWIEIATGATNYSEPLTDLATAYATVADAGTFVAAGETLISAGVDATATIQLIETLLTTVAASDTVSGAISQTEALLASIQAVATVADARAAVEQLAATITVTDEVSDSISGAAVENLTTTAQAATSVADVVAALDTFHAAITATVTVTDDVVSGLAENLLTSATAIDSVADLQLMVDNLTIMAQSQTSLAEINAYLQQLVTAATVTDSVTDVLVGAFIGRYVFRDYCTSRQFTDYCTPRRFIDLCSPRRFVDYCSPRGRA